MEFLTHSGTLAPILLAYQFQIFRFCIHPQDPLCNHNHGILHFPCVGQIFTWDDGEYFVLRMLI
jgi:hypothetical protein